LYLRPFMYARCSLGSSINPNIPTCCSHRRSLLLQHRRVLLQVVTVIGRWPGLVLRRSGPIGLTRLGGRSRSRHTDRRGSAATRARA
jgi:hypothetical protein